MKKVFLVHPRSTRKISLVKFLPLLLIPGLYFPLTRVLKIQAIECYTQYGPCPPSYIETLGQFKNQSLLLPPASAIKKHLVQFPDVKTVNVYRHLPSTLVVSIASRKPLGAIGSSVLGAQVALADQEGIIFSHSTNPGLPVLISSELPGISHHLSHNQAQALKVLNVISSALEYQVSGSIEGTTLSISASDGQIIIVDINKPIDQWYASLQLILTRSKITANTPRVIDMRFNSPVIKY